MKGNIDEVFLLNQRVSIGHQIREIRESKGITKEELAVSMGIKSSTISKVELGKWNFDLKMFSLFSSHLSFKIKLDLSE